MAQHGKTRRRFVRRAQDGGNAMTMSIMKCQGFFFQGVIFQSRIMLGDYIPVAQQKKISQDIRVRQAGQSR